MRKEGNLHATKPLLNKSAYPQSRLHRHKYFQQQNMKNTPKQIPSKTHG